MNEAYQWIKVLQEEFGTSADITLEVVGVSIAMSVEWERDGIKHEIEVKAHAAAAENCDELKMMAKNIVMRWRQHEQAEGDWRPMETAPKDGQAIQAEIPGHGKDNIIGWFSGFYDWYGKPAEGWMMIESQEPPDSWTGGVCWRKNEDGEPSVQPVAWRPL